jgi:hypothetical protein
MRNYTVLSTYVDEHGTKIENCLDEETGELIDRVASTNILMDLEYISPIDISGITSRLKFEEVVAGKIGRKRYNLWVGSSLLDLAIDKQVHPAPLCVLFYLGRSVAYNNLAYTSVQDIIKGTGHTKSTVYMALQTLEGIGLIKDVGVNLDRESDRLFTVNPRYFFLGYYPYRQELVKGWYK